MAKTKIIPVILCGGSGTRLWPASRASYPKQFLPLAGERTLLQDAALRVADPDRFQTPIVVANHEHRFIAAEQLEQIGVKAVLALEPVRRDSAAAIGAAARIALDRDPNALILVVASDHVITDPAGFLAAVDRGLPAAGVGRIVTFGVKPSRPTSKYGYIRAGAPLAGADGVMEVAAFVEKPEPALAEKLVAEGCVWNSGNFLARAETLLSELARLAPAIAGPAAAAVERATSDLDFLRLDPESFAAAEANSIDYAVMERTPLAAVAPAEFGWSDVGGWSALWDVAERDAAGNALIGPSAAADSRNCYVRSEKHFTAVVGVEDLVVVSTGDAVLVTTRGRSDEVKDLVARLAADGEGTATQAAFMHRPWGSYQIIDHGGRFQVKRITVKPGRKLSLQSHAHRAEHWIVVRGVARVTINEEARLIGENESVYIPLGARHRLENPGEEPLDLIEVQSGAYLGEDDIVRYEDDYRRI
ncbi:mannose-1-phosphate guanylyltransferase/mannose-6-phosphate isomerase [Hansschlegelia sp.]|uniref:mannose-1-phosphate guanylyltransferase/mannose-6-phosphate isomerase n=1 Tax=Hansschlegelia sp. TaxID=2041892 RepID=UPI002CEFE98F|nr:mannose-1-phosphate guanylyltransferase/mannose-6-phosphate isomerase [Hansschlegelia sp.]HVI27662.1 mannose-1-phosphate guanylyltransferase/mannose-6-phosphate isomerase [Hansschlegelia sp.]